MLRSNPPFRADHVGSLIRPEKLRAARRDFLAAKLDAKALRAIEDACIRDAVALQERAGLQAVTDGEFRRQSFRDGFFDNTDGYSEDRYETDFEFHYEDGSTRRASPVPKAVAKLKRRNGMVTGDFAALKSLTDRTPKVTLPSPSTNHFFIGDASFRDGPYDTAADYMADVSALYREELAALAELGCRYVQIDEVPLPVMCDPGVREILRRRGEDPEAVRDLYCDAIDAAVRNRPDGMTVVVHMCRGNEGTGGLGSGSYDWIAERAFACHVDGFFLEYDTPRAGDFVSLKHVADDRLVVLGLMSTKRSELEPADDLKRRVDEAARVVDLDRLCLCPQCGFASHYNYDRLTIDDEERKLAHLVAVADEIWGVAA